MRGVKSEDGKCPYVGHTRSKILRMLKRTTFGIVLTASVLACPIAPAHAENLNQALSSAYKYNPRLDAERARLRATDESVAQAMSGYRPRINGSADVGIEDNRIRLRKETLTQAGTPATGVGVRTNPGSLRSGDTIYPRGYGVNLQQNIFDSFQTRNAVSEAEANVRAGREVLRNVEREVLLDAVTAYMDVVRDQAVVRLRENNVRVLSRELQATQDRFDVGEVTRTDVAQAQARRAGSVSNLDLARANLKTARAAYQRVIGNPASNLMVPRVPNQLLPSTLPRALDIGRNENPLVIAALYTEQSARHTVDRIRSELLPKVTLEAGYNNRFHTSSDIAETENTFLTGRLNVPIYQGGEVSARVRAAKHTHVSRIQEIEDARTQVRQEIVAAWSQLQAAEAQLESDRTQVSANQVALNGVREEEKVGQRTLLDVLNAELELLNSQVQLETTQRNLIVAAYAVLSAVGRLDAAHLGVASYVYAPEEHYFDVRRKWWGVDITHEDGRREHFDFWDSHGRHEPAK